MDKTKNTIKIKKKTSTLKNKKVKTNNKVIKNENNMNDNLVNDNLERIDEYYSLKNKYDMYVKKIQSRIFKNKELSKIEKSAKIKELTYKCINCNREGGTIFKRDKTMLIAKCGNQSNPCKLNMRVYRGESYNVQDLYENTRKELHEIENAIIETKLSATYNFIDEEKAINIFEDIQNAYREINNLTEKYKNRYENIIHNRENINILKEKRNNLFSYMNEIQNLYKEYTNTNKKEFLYEIINMYKDTIQPLMTEIRDKTYKHVELVCDNIFMPIPCDYGLYTLIENPFTIKDLQIEDKNL